MVTLLLQIFLLLLAAYLLGALLACLVKRAFASDFVTEAPAAKPADAAVPASDPPPAYRAPEPQAPAAGTDRFGRALTGGQTAPVAPAPAAAAPTAAAAAPVVVPVPAPPAPPAQPAPPPPPVAPVTSAATSAATAAAAASAAVAAARAATAQAPQPPAPPAPAMPAVTAPVVAQTKAPEPARLPDDLTRIRAIDAHLQGRLYALGVHHFGQISAWTPGDVTRMSQSLGFAGRIEKENWIEQAQILAKGGDTDYSRRQREASSAAVRPPTAAETAVAAATAIASATAAAQKLGSTVPDSPRPVRLAEAIRDQGTKAAATEPAPAPTPPSEQKTDYSHLRSVRSEALRSEPIAAGGTFNDLKRIRGIGVLIEKRLNSLGISTYEQIANWTGADIERIGQHIEPRGRIERENWIEQARILASGGQTDYARRFDRGEIDQGT